MNLCPKVTVLVPVYNVERYLRQCLESLRAQTLHEMEVILLDDGSTDGCAAICDEFVEHDARFRAIHKPNSGYGATMNVGLREAKGEYIGIVESDDWVEPEMFEELYAMVTEQHVPVVKSNFFEYQMDGESRYRKIIPLQDEDQRLCPAYRSSIFYAQPSIWSAIYERRFLLENDIRFLESPGASYQDTSFNFKVWACASDVFLSSRAFYHYRVDNAASSVKASGKIFCIVDEWEEIERFIAQYPEKANSSSRLRSHMKWNNYMWNWKRLDAPGRAAFEPMIRNAFAGYSKARLFCHEFRRRLEWQDFVLIMGEPPLKKPFTRLIHSLVRPLYKRKISEEVITYRIFFSLFRIQRRIPSWEMLPSFADMPEKDATASRLDSSFNA